MEAELSREQKLSADIDMRMLEFFEFVDALHECIEDEDVRDYVFQLIRFAYGQGYTHAWSEERQGSLFTDNGYLHPGLFYS